MVELLLTLGDTMVQIVVVAVSSSSSSRSIRNASENTPSVSSRTSRILIFSGDTGKRSRVIQLSSKIHPGTPSVCMCGGYVYATTDTFSDGCECVGGVGWFVFFFTP